MTEDDSDYLIGLGMPLDPPEPPSSMGDKIAGYGTAIIGLLLAGGLLFGQMLP